jgi:hypothetical protein
MPARITLGVVKDMWGDQPYQKRAQRALPLLVRQALVQKPIYYQQLADELAMPLARNLNYVLGSIGVTLKKLGRKWNEPIPSIQSLAINKASKHPGPGFFGGKIAYQRLTKKQREARVQSLFVEVYSYPKWPQVLKALKLEPTKTNAATIVEEARNFHPRGESQRHKQLKEAIAQKPELVHLPVSSQCLGTEYSLPSGDALDVFFQRGRHLYAVEVKSALSPVGDIARGLFQCVKYQAVLEAWKSSQGQEVDVSVILALEAALPNELLSLKNALQITVVELVSSS